MTTTARHPRPAGPAGGTGASPTYLRRPAAGYLDGVAVELAATKRRLLDLLGPTAGARVLDVGCGTGLDVLAAAERVGGDGRVVGVDSSEGLIAEARARASTGAPVEFHVADAGRLPFADGEFDASRSERVFQHIPDPDRAAAELVRVTRPGGRVLVADPDHGMWAPDHSDAALTTTLMSWWVTHLTNPWMGRRLPALLRGAGLAGVRVELLPVVLTDLAAADAVLGIGRTAAWAAEQGVVPAAAAAAWDEELRARDADGSFLLCGALIAAYGDRPAGA